MTFIPPEPRNQLINEICKNGLLEEYRDTIRAILEEIFANGAKVSCKYNETASNIDRDRVRPYHIRVSMIEVKHPLNIIWNILHEYGHYLDWPVKQEDSRIDREKTAWRYAEQMLPKYPKLLDGIAYFEHHKNWCLSTYYAAEKVRKEV